MLGNQLDCRMFHFRLSAVFVQLSGLILQVKALGASRETLSLQRSHPSLLLHVNKLNPHSHLCLLPLSLSFTVHVMFAQFTTQQVFPLLTLKGQESSWKNLSVSTHHHQECPSGPNQAVLCCWARGDGVERRQGLIHRAERVSQRVLTSKGAPIAGKAVSHRPVSVFV